MSTGVFDDLQTALGLTDPTNIADVSDASATRPYVFATDWEITGINGLIQNTSGPYCEGDDIKVEMDFSGAGQSFRQLKIETSLYTVNTSQNCTFQNFSSPGVLRFTVDSNVGVTSGNTIGVTFDNVFNNASGVGTEQTTSFDTNDYGVTCDAISYDGNNDDVTVTYTIECGTADFEVDLYRSVDTNQSQVGTSPLQTQTSRGTYSVTDSNPDSGQSSSKYEVRVTDSNGNGLTVTCTITTSFPI